MGSFMRNRSHHLCNRVGGYWVRLKIKCPRSANVPYLKHMRAFLTRPGSKWGLADPRFSLHQFDRLRTVLPAPLHATVQRLERICEEERQLSRQIRLHHLLHGWLLIHVPLSLALLALALVHIAMALRY